MNCQNYQDLFSAYLDRELPAEDQKAVGQHLETCLACQKDLRSILAIKESVRATPLPSMPADLVAQIEERTFFRNRRWEIFKAWGVPTLAVAAALGAWAVLHVRVISAPHSLPNIPLAQLQKPPAASHPQVAWNTNSDSDTMKDLQ
jgi:anti-sigma factor RsiW